MPTISVVGLGYPIGGPYRRIDRHLELGSRSILGQGSPIGYPEPTTEIASILYIDLFRLEFAIHSSTARRRLGCQGDDGDVADNVTTSRRAHDVLPNTCLETARKPIFMASRQLRSQSRE
ncbi:hypothetical protein CRG98_011619 [Punica granatum]|uniref:Uncharacterized protein n=1 Tax=Punica granatum TaxID=22663 RepID=A0A2I0KIL8_PUNGR|nr:hypothetical protein CRG98_011619 [Punica granatum]